MSAVARRLGCVSLPAFPLQVLLQDHPDWAERPAAVIEADRPTARVTWINEPARAQGVLPGQRYAGALALAQDLRAAVVDDARILQALEQVTLTLRGFSPHIERDEGRLGLLWLDASGLGTLHPSLIAWAEGIRGTLLTGGYQAVVVVGFRRQHTAAIAAQAVETAVYQDLTDELEAARAVPLRRLDLDPDIRDNLRALGVHTLGDVLRLPERGLRERYGREAARLRRIASGEDGPPLPAVPEVLPLRVRRQLAGPVADMTAVVFLIKGLLPRLLRRLSARGRAVAVLRITLTLDGEAPFETRIKPADPTLDERQLIELVRLRLDGMPIAAAVEEVALTVDPVQISWEQTGLFSLRQQRDLDAANRALARVRAELGEDCVRRAQLREGHLPEARFHWLPVERLGRPDPGPGGRLPLIRRVLAKPRPIRPPSRHDRDDGWLPLDPQTGPVRRNVGPYLVSGGWWRTEITRAYHFLETGGGDLLWVYWDQRRRRWFVQGFVE